jgi:hypothetical protein
MSRPARRSVVLALPVGIAAALGCTVGLAAASAGAAQGCVNEQVRIEEPYAGVLPDCRAYEQVSPVEKNYADALGAITSVRSSPIGSAVTFNSLGPFPLGGGAGEGSSQLFSSYLSARGGEGWLTDALEPAVSPSGSASPLAVSEDLAYTFDESNNGPPLLSEPGVLEGRQAVYVRNNSTGVYRLLFQVKAGEAASFFLVGTAEEDSRVFFESENQLRPEARTGVRNLYEWYEGKLCLVDLLPGGVPAEGGSAGWRGPGDGEASYFVQNAVSADGSRVFFTDLGTGRLYVREQQPGGEGETVEVSSGPAAWQAATPDGSQAFYVEEGVLYRFDLEGAHRVALTPAGGEVLGTLGLATDGSYVYFAAKGALVSGGVSGGENIYGWHEGALSLVSTGGEAADWTPHILEGAGPDEGVRSSRLSSDGRTLMFTSKASLTSYQNQAQSEVYVYSATTRQVTCVSCNPDGTPATSGALLYHLENDGSVAPPTIYPWDLPRNLSADGSKVFFETEEALLPADSNSEMDVYEWERGGSGSCPPGEAGGCLYLITSGVSSEPSYFAEASSSGSDVFLFTRQSLVGQDEDELVDLYDAAEGGGIAAQNPAPAVAPCLGEACHPPQAPAAEPGLAVSQVFAGASNPVAPTEVIATAKPKPKPKPAKCKQGLTRKHNKCVKPKSNSKKKRGKAKKSSRRSN